MREFEPPGSKPPGSRVLGPVLRLHLTDLRAPDIAFLSASSSSINLKLVAMVLQDLISSRDQYTTCQDSNQKMLSAQICRIGGL